MSTIINKNPERRVQYKIGSDKTQIMFPNLECISTELLQDILPSGSTPAGDSAYITDASDLVPVESLKVNIQPVQSGTGDPSPENVRAISGWDTVKVTRGGKNIYPVKIGDDVFSNSSGASHSNNNGILVVVPDPTKNNSGVYSTNSATAIMRPFFGTLVGTYTYSFDVKASQAVTCTLGISGKGMKTNFPVTTDWQRVSITADFNKDGASSGFVVYANMSSATIEVKDFQIETGSTVTSYEPYQGNTYNIPLGRTVYGGTLDVTTGELVVDKAMIESYNGETLPSEWISDRDVYAAGTTPTTGAQVVYELTTPQTYTLTPQQVTLLKGINNVFADAGTVEVKYSADIQLYIDSKIAETQALVLEN